MISFGTILEFGKYKGHKVDKYPEGTVPFNYLIYLRDKTNIILSEDLLTTLQNQEKRMEIIKNKNSVNGTESSSSTWTPNICSLCGQRHVMACGYY